MASSSSPARDLFVGLDVGADSVKLLALRRDEVGRLGRAVADVREHRREPAPVVREMLEALPWSRVARIAVTGRHARLFDLPRVPVKEAQLEGLRHHRPELASVTLVSIGGHGFSVLEARAGGSTVFRENGRCSQGTGNFLSQLVERFELTLEEAAALAAPVTQPAPLSGRCPVILKTDMTHLANKGEDRARILAGLYDAVCENVQVLVKPALAPPDVVLIGGVTRASRVRARFGEWLAKHGMRLVDTDLHVALFCEAAGCAALAARAAQTAGLVGLADAPRDVEAVFATSEAKHLSKVPSLAGSLSRVRRMRAPAMPSLSPECGTAPRRFVLGLDIGSTGSKCVAVDAREGEVLWESYLGTGGDPVGAAKALVARLRETELRHHELVGFGATGSGREIVGSLLSVSFGEERVYVLNEIAAHAEGARHFDADVDTIFEIGGQDAKYVRLDGGRVVDAAMNEACSAGTGSFIAEQGKRFEGVRDVVHLGEIAAGAEEGVSLGQHCSVFMAEVIDEAVAAGAPQESIVAGLYDSIVQNYLNRVKGPRTVGRRIFCQGMPFASDALAAAVARRTGSDVVVPPNPGTIGALGIALLARRGLVLEGRAPLAVDAFLEARVVAKDTFPCPSTKGCGEPGNRCRVDRLRVDVAGESRKFLWGGSCSLYDKGARRRKLPDLTPDPFREREALVDAIVAKASLRRGRPTIGVTDELVLKSLFPFFATYLDALGFDLVVRRESDHATLKRGIEGANVPFCAPMQQYHGCVSALRELDTDYLLLPMLRSLPRTSGEPVATLCPIVQGSQEVMRLDLPKGGPKLLLPVIDVGPEGLGSEELRRSCERLAAELAVEGPLVEVAFERARAAQDAFDDARIEIGRRALAFCGERGVTPVIVLGRVYTIYNPVLSSNVPALVREQGALPIPVDCYPVDDATPTFGRVYWGHAQRSLRAAHQIRRTPGQYAVYCSNYSCGPDSFNLHFFAYTMEGRPFAVIETDGHSGDAGTKTRIEAFLHCVREAAGAAASPPKDFAAVVARGTKMADVRRRGELLLIPRMGPDAEVLAAGYRGLGFRSEALPMPDEGALAEGRRHTSGKECLPMTLTSGALLQRVRAAPPSERFAFFMPLANGPCRFGAYHLLHELILERTGLAERVRVFSPGDDDYFAEAERGFHVLVWAGFLAQDLLQQALYHARPTELSAGTANRIYARYMRRLLELMEREAAGDLSLWRALGQVGTGHLFGVGPLLREAASSFAAIHDGDRAVPTVQVVGEIYVRCDPSANAFVIDALGERGVRVRFAPFTEWIEYTTWVAGEKRREGISRDPKHPLLRQLTAAVQSRIQALTYEAMAPALGWPRRTKVTDTLRAAAPYVRPELFGEAALTIGGPVHEHREGLIDGVLSVGPLECMPNKIAEAQLFHAAEREGLLSLTLPLNGEPFDAEVLDGFVYALRARFAQRRSEGERTARAAPRTTPSSNAWPMFDGARRMGALAAGLVPLAAQSAIRERWRRVRRALPVLPG